MSQAPVQLNYSQPPQQSNGREGFLLRFCAALIDGVFAGIPALILTRVGGDQVGPFLGAAVVLGYSTLEIFKAATPGKSLLKLKIQNEDGSDASRDVLFKRWTIKQVPNALRVVAGIFMLISLNAIAALVGWVGVLALIGYVISCCLTFKPQRQALHDTLTHTAVFKTQSAVAAAMPTPEQQPQRQAA